MSAYGPPKFICGAPSPYGGLSAARKYSRAELGWMGHCNQSVKNEDGRCWRHTLTTPKGQA